MESKNLTRELLKRMFGNIGAVPGDNFGRVGITTPEFNSKNKFPFEGNQYPVFSGTLSKHLTPINFILTNIGSKNESEFLSVIDIPHQNTAIGIYLESDNLDPLDIRSDSSFLIRNEDKWVPAPIYQQLNCAALIEYLTQEGLTWEPHKEDEKLFSLLLTLVDDPTEAA